MTVTDWVKRTGMQMDVMGPRAGARAAGLSLWQGVAHRAGGYLDHDDTETVWERDWDVLVLLDACRPGALTTLAHEYDFLPASTPTTRSAASCSKRWLEATFSEARVDEVSETAYVTGNVFSREFGTDGLVDADDFATLNEVWRSGWDDDVGNVSPRAMTNEAIRAWRSDHAEQMIVHYMQPHAPYRRLSTPSGFSNPGEAGSGHRLTVWDMLRGGHLSDWAAREAYRDNLRWALDEVGVLLNNCDADDVVLSADHGELFGEYGLYSHPDVPLDQLRTVPWVEITATDERTRVADEEPEETDATVSEQLEALGYR